MPIRLRLLPKGERSGVTVPSVESSGQYATSPCRISLGCACTDTQASIMQPANGSILSTGIRIRLLWVMDNRLRINPQYFRNRVVWGENSSGLENIESRRNNYKLLRCNSTI